MKGRKEKMEKTKKTAKKVLVLSIVLMMLSMIVVSCIQTGGGKITCKELVWETDDGVTMHGDLYIPKGASPDNKLPAIVTSHGTYNNKEMQDANFVELARRGFIVLTIDCPLHGNSEIAPAMILPDDPSKLGIWESVLMLSRLPYVDTARIGVTGHSRGGENCDYAIMYDNKFETNLIASALYNCYDPTYINKETGEFENVLGTKDVAIISCVYDEFFHKRPGEGPNGETLWAPYFMEGEKAQSFLYFGKDPEGLEPREAYTVYKETIDGKECSRIIYRPEIIHPWSHFSTKSTSYVIQWFSDTLGAPNYIDPSNQIWPVKEAFNFVGVIGFVLFIISFTILMTFTPCFADLRASEIVQPAAIDKTGKKWFWGSLIAGAIFGTLIYVKLVAGALTIKVQQTESLGLGLWSACCGVFSILSMIITYFAYGKKNGMDLTARGVKMPVKKLAKTILLAVIVICVAISWVFFADYFFNTDFRFWTLAIKAFEPFLLTYSLKYMPLFLLFYIPASVAANSFNYNTVGKKSWVNLLIVAVFVAIPAMVIPWIQYIVYFNTNFPLWGLSNLKEVMVVLWLFPILLILIGTTIQSRLIYKATNNPYLSGIISGAIIAIMTCTNTMTVLL